MRINELGSISDHPLALAVDIHAAESLRRMPLREIHPTASQKISKHESKHRAALEAIFSRPVPMSLEWKRIETLFKSLGVQVIEGDGSRVKFLLNGELASFHRPHPAKEAKPYQVRDARTNAGTMP